MAGAGGDLDRIVFHVVAMDRNPACHRASSTPPSLLRGVVQGETVALALLGAAVTRRRHGLIQTRSRHLNEVGEPSFDALTIEHNGILAGAAPEPEVYYCGTCLVRRYEP